MNRARIAALLEEIRLELELPDDGTPEPEPTRRAKREPRKLTDIDKARARRALRRKGIQV